ncbi:EAL domain-containing protein [Pseudomonas sp. NPDC090202]|uniref:bifunctional diguanylate cyclase/phosphodiesterase n=1 Tax=unclassified Pseudomonas TaxID=196821 RepID=UPI003816B26F
MSKPALARWVGNRRSRQLILRLFPAIGALLLLIGLGGYLLVKNALSQDLDVQQRSRIFISRTMDQVRNEVARNIINYAKWAEAYKHLHVTVDKVWADEQRNVGAVPYELYGYNGVLVIDGHDHTSYAVIDGRPSQIDVRDWLKGDLDGLIAEARRTHQEDDGIVRALKVDGMPALAAAATISAGWDPSITEIPGPASVMIFVSVLDPAKLAHLSETYGLPALTVAEQPRSGFESMPLLSSDILLDWTPPKPGMELLQRTLPLFIAGVLTLVIVLTMLLRHALASARQIDAQFAALLASQDELSGSEQRFRDIAEAASDWLWEVDATGHLTYLSERFTEVTGEQREAWLGRSLADLLKPEGLALPEWLSQTASDSGERGSLLCHYHDHGGRRRICKLMARAMPGAAGYRGTASDITDEVEAQAEVRHLSLHDSLTGLPNRHRLHQFLADQLDRQPPQALAVLSLDLDRFKPVNDALGHAVGDRVLQEVAQRLQRHGQPDGMVARLGGDEFIVVLLGDPQLADLTGLCARLVEELRRPFELGSHTVFIGTSIGVALAPDHARTAAELLRLGDIALYQAKAAGRNTWRFYVEDMNARLLARRELEHELREALLGDQLRLHYQPRYATVAGSLRSFEALVRWQHPQRGLLQPDTFIPLAEETGLIQPLGRWVLNHACRQAMHWPAEVGLSVNLSPGQLAENEDVVAVVADALRDSGLPAHRLELEITERVFLDHAHGALATLTALRALGVRLSLDDFGTGFSSLAYLRNYPLDGIKIDRSFISNLTVRGNDQAIVQAMIDLGRSLGITVTAEGVETLEQLECLQLRHCDEVQGFHFSKALPPEQLGPLFGVETSGA